MGVSGRIWRARWEEQWEKLLALQLLAWNPHVIVDTISKSAIA
jgi:hypothetical protein